MTTIPDMSQVLCPVADCCLGIDIILQSADNVEIGAHRQNLALFSEGFCPSLSAPVTLAIERASYRENSATLMRLLHLMHSEVPPEYDVLPFAEARELSEAAHKYVVYQAIPFCNLLMKQHLDDYPLRVLEYALTYNVQRLRDAALPKTLTLSTQEVARVLDLHDAALIGWVRQRQDLRDKVFAVMNRPPLIMHKGGIPTKRCPYWHRFFGAVAAIIFKRGALVLSDDIENSIDRYKHMLDECQWCLKVIQEWDTMRASLASPHDHISASGQSATPSKSAVDLEVNRMKVMKILANPPTVPHKGGSARCENWLSFYGQLVAHFFERGLPDAIGAYEVGVGNFRKSLNDCFHCGIVLDRWRGQLAPYCD
ncbi:hypothetical protein C8J56DRAFT_837444 [Mycena floridula]|nr:hypothetical protein C8J56DRAFT_837444 [Mycena floridula]